jgi:hypothetical protein
VEVGRVEICAEKGAAGSGVEQWMDLSRTY